MFTGARYARSGEVNIAYQVVGDGPMDLVLTFAWVSHLAYICLSVVGTNAELGVTWLHSYVSEDHKKTVRVLDPYFYLAANGR